MSNALEEEFRHRLAAIEHGPWAGSVTEAQRKLAPVDNLNLPSSEELFIDLDQIKLSLPNKRRNSRLTRVLRSHFEDEEGITSPTEIETRDALDYALMLPMLYELAVQTGYLPSEAITRPARKILISLLWSRAARSFVTAYDYVLLPMLAARVGVSGFGQVRAPKPNPHASLRFAGFLAHLRAFYSDEGIQIWARFLDDYIEEENEQDKLWEYLHGERKTPPKQIEELLNGCHRFVTSLASAFNIFDDDELGRFGLFHSYWLQRFFGYEIDNNRYVKNELWDRNDSWAHTISKSQHLIPRGTDPEVAKVYRRQFSDQVELLERTFRAVRLQMKHSSGPVPTRESSNQDLATT